jgi:hypothetical protein
MSSDTGGPRLSGQARVHDVWSAALNGRDWIHKDDLNLSLIIGELANVSVLQRDGGGYRFRLAGSAVRAEFEREARGAFVDEIDDCRGSAAWCEGLNRSLEMLKPVLGRTRTEDGLVHFWLRLPMSSDGETVDLVLCHDRFLPMEALADPDRYARTADQRLRLDSSELQAA